MGGSSGGVRERERKYEVADGSALPDPAGLFDLVVGSSDEFELDATYFDTRDLRLARAGITLRRRVGGADAGWHLKLPVDRDQRDELQVPLDRPPVTAPDTPPAELVALTRVHVRGARLEPVAKIVTRRRRWRLTGAAGDELAELVEDRVHGIRLAPASGAEDWRELEVELVGDAPLRLLDVLESGLRAVGARRSAAPSKLSRVLGDQLPSPSRPAVRRRPTAGDAVLTYLRAQVDTLRALDPQVRLDVPDALHRMRSTARRLRSALQGHRRVLDRERTGPLVEDLRWLGAELAAARDGEVLAGRFTAAVAELPEQDVLGPVRAQLTRRFSRARADGRARALAALDGDRYLDLQRKLDDLLTDPPLAERAGRKAPRELRRAVGRSVRRAAVRMGAADTAGTAADRDAALHEVRKAVKRARHVAEVAEPALGTPARTLRKRIKGVQSILGDHHDAVVARPVLRELGAQAAADGGNGFTFGVLHARERATADALDARLPRAWQRMRTARLR